MKNTRENTNFVGLMLFYLVELEANILYRFEDLFPEIQKLPLSEPVEVLLDAMKYVIDLDQIDKCVIRKDLDEFIKTFGCMKYNKLEKCCSSNLLSRKSFALLRTSIEYTLKKKFDLIDIIDSNTKIHSEQLESKIITYQLLTAQTSQMCAAVITEFQANHITTFLESIFISISEHFVDSSNFAAFLETVKSKESVSSCTFFLVNFIGKIDDTSVVKLIELASVHNSVRLLVKSNPYINRVLQLKNVSCYFSSFIGGKDDSKTCIVKYLQNSSFALSPSIHSEVESKRFIRMENDVFLSYREIMLQNYITSTNWKEQVKQSIGNYEKDVPVDSLVIVCPWTELIQWSVKKIINSHSATLTMEEIKEVSTISSYTRNVDKNSESKKKILLILDAHLLSSDKKLTLLSNTDERYFLIFLAKNLVSEDLTLFKSVTHPQITFEDLKEITLPAMNRLILSLIIAFGNLSFNVELKSLMDVDIKHLCNIVALNMTSVPKHIVLDFILLLDEFCKISSLELMQINFPHQIDSLSAILRLIAWFVVCAAVNFQESPPGEKFLYSFPVFLHCIQSISCYSQRRRIELWLNFIALHCDIEKKLPEISLPNGNNMDSNNILTYFVRQEYDCTAPYYISHIPDQIISEESSFRQLALANQSLDWNGNSKRVAFISNLSMLTIMTAFHYEILKVLCCNPILTLFELLISINTSCKPDIQITMLLQRFLDIIQDQYLLCMVDKHGAPLRSYISLIKWICLLKACPLGLSNQKKIGLKEIDIENLLAERIPISHFEQSGHDVIAAILSMNNPPNLIALNTALLTYLTNLGTFNELIYVEPENASSETTNTPQIPLQVQWNVNEYGIVVGDKKFTPFGAVLIDFVGHSKCKNSQTILRKKQKKTFLVTHFLWKLSEFIHDKDQVQNIVPPANTLEADEDQWKQFITRVDNIIFDKGIDDEPQENISFKNSSFWFNLMRMSPTGFSAIINRCALKAQITLFTYFLSTLLSWQMEKENILLILKYLFSIFAGIESLNKWYFFSLLLENPRFNHFLSTIKRLQLPVDALSDVLEDANISDTITLTVIKGYLKEDVIPLDKALPIAHFKFLQNIYLNRYSDSKFAQSESKEVKEEIIAVVNNLCELPRDDIEFLYQLIMKNLDNNYILITICWSLLLTNPLPVQLEKAEVMTGILNILLAHPKVKLLENIKKNINMVDNFGKFLCLPSALDFNTINFFQSYYLAKFDHPVKLSTFTLCQKQGEKLFPSYVISTYNISHPRQIICKLLENAMKDCLIKECESDTLIELLIKAKVKQDPKWNTKICKCFPLAVSNGLSARTIRRNIQTLILSVKINESYNSELIRTTYYLRTVILCWTHQAGITLEDILPFFKANNIEHADVNYLQSLVTPPENDVVSKTTLYPFPSLLDTQLETTSNSQLCGNTIEDATYTIRLYQSLFSWSKRNIKLPLITELLEKSDKNPREFFPTEIYKNLFKNGLHMLAVLIAPLIMASYKSKRVINIAKKERSIYSIAEVQTSLAAFIQYIKRNCLDSGIEQESISREIEGFIGNVNSCLSKYEKNELPYLQAILHRSITSVIGFQIEVGEDGKLLDNSYSNCGWIHSIIYERMSKLKMQHCKLSTNEIYFCAQNEYIKFTSKLTFNASPSPFMIFSNDEFQDFNYKCFAESTPVSVPCDISPDQLFEESKPKAILDQSNEQNKVKRTIIRPIIFTSSKFEKKVESIAKRPSKSKKKESSVMGSTLPSNLTIDCNDLLRVDLNGRVISVMTGAACSFYEIGENRLKFTSDDKINVLPITKVYGFSTFLRAWEFLDRLPSGCNIFFSGLVFVKRFASWVPYTIVSPDKHLFLWDYILLLNWGISNLTLPSLLLNLVNVVLDIIRTNIESDLDINVLFFLNEFIFLLLK